MPVESQPRNESIPPDDRGDATDSSYGRSERFDLSVTGWAALGGSALLLLLLAYFLLTVVPPMTRPTPYFETITEQVSKSAVGKKGNIDRLSVDLVVLLEYTNADIRALNVQVAFSLIGGLAIATVGLILFAVGATDKVAVSGQAHEWRWQLTTAAPGTVAIILGGIMMIVGVSKPTLRGMNARISRPEALELAEEKRKVPTTPVEDSSEEATGDRGDDEVAPVGNDVDV